MATSESAVLYAERFLGRHLLKEGNGVSTWLGEDRETGARVVIKAANATAAVRLRLEREARLLQGLEWPGVPRVLRVGVREASAFMVLEYVDGPTLRERLDRGPLDLTAALAVAVGIFEGLREAHQAGVLHRDVKPGNLVLRTRGETIEGCTLIDFGVAWSVWDNSVPRAGTGLYMAPEQAGLLAAGVGEAADLYSAGVVLYEALAGQTPFSGETVGEVLRAHLTVVPPPLRTLGLDVPAAVDEVLQRLLRKEPRERYRSAEGVLRDLSQIREALARGVAEPRVVVGGGEASGALADPGFVAREAELAQVAEVLELARRGPGGLVAVEAPSGGGKTRLLDEVALEATRKGAVVLRGNAYEQQAPVPFQMLVGVAAGLESLVRLHPELRDPVRRRMGPQAEAAAAALPQLAPLLTERPVPAMGPEDYAEARTLRALRALLESVGTPLAPALILLDDAQWADEMTLRLLGTRDWLPPQTVVVVAWRSEEVSEGHPLRALEPIRRLNLPALDRQALHDLFSSMAGSLPPEVEEAASQACTGNPFMAVEMLRGMVETGALVAGEAGWEADSLALRGVQSSHRAGALLARRLELLSPEAAEVLSLAAVLGKEFPLERVAALSGQPDPLGCLEEGRRRRLLWAVPQSDRFQFVHDRVRQALLERLAPARRRELHRAAAEHMELRSPAEVYELAYHFDQAGEPSRALPYALTAGAEARARNALEVAEAQLRIAKAASQVEPTVRLQVMEGLGDVLMLRGRYAEAAEHYRAAQPLVSGAVAGAGLLGKLGDLYFRQGNVAEAERLLGEALKLLGRPVPARAWQRRLGLVKLAAEQALHTFFPRWRVGRRKPAGGEADLLAAQLLNRLSYAWWFSRGAPDILWAHLSSLNLSETYCDNPVRAQNYSNHAVAMTSLPWFRRSLHYGRLGVAMRRRLGDLWGEGQTLGQYGIALYAASCLEEALEVQHQAMEILERTGGLWEYHTALNQAAQILQRLGRLPEARRAAQEAWRSGVEVGDSQARATALGTWARIDPLGISGEKIQEEIQDLATDVAHRSWLLEGEGIRRLARGEVEQALEALNAAYDTVKKAGKRDEYVASTPCWLATALRRQAEELPALHPGRPEALGRAARAAQEALRWAWSYRNNLPHALREAALVAALRERPREARRLLDRSLEAAERLGLRWERALTLTERARLGGSPDDGEAARRALAECGAEEMTGTAPAQPAVTLSLADRFSTVLEEGRRVASALSREDVFGSLAQAAGSLFRVESCGVVGSDGEDVLAGQPGPVSGTLVEQAVRTRAPVTMAEPDAAGGPTESLLFSGVRSALCAPVLVRGYVVACLYLTHCLVGGLFGGEEKRLAAYLTALAGAALESVAGHEAARAERERVHQQELEVQRLEERRHALAALFGVASHDLGTPLHLCKLYAEQLRVGMPGPQLENCRRVLQMASRKAAGLVRLYLDAAGSEAGRQMEIVARPFDLAELTREVADFYAESWRMERGEVELDCDLEPVVVWGDPERMGQVVANLVGNAMKFSPAGGPVRLRVRQVDGMAEGSVTDQGPGLAQTEQARLFQPFERLGSGRPGTGLGLWIARLVVEAHGGTVGVVSEPGQGSQFWFRVPTQDSSGQVMA